ncbi:MAG: hypothetical protein MUF34_12635, partial [Polyangiaceae bacterium]|nr:hypothetical protein [Polyangiaceae bacterium]
PSKSGGETRSSAESTASPPPELAKPTGSAEGAPSEAPKAPPGPDADTGDGCGSSSPGVT